MRRVMLVGAVAVVLTASAARADLGPPRPRPPIPQPQPQQPTRIKVNIVYDEKATEPRMIIPLGVLLNQAAIGAGGVGAFGNFGGQVGVGGAIGFGGGPIPGGAQGIPPGGVQIGQIGVGGAIGFGGGVPPGGVPGVPPGAGQAGGGVFGAQGLPPGGQPQPGGQPGTAPPLPPRRGSLPLSTIVVALALTLSFTTGGLWMVRRGVNIPEKAVKPLVMVFVALSLTVLATAAVANRAPPFVRPPQPQPQPQPAQNLPGPLPALLRMDGVRVDVVPQGDTVRVILTKKQKELIQNPAKEEK